MNDLHKSTATRGPGSFKKRVALILVIIAALCALGIGIFYRYIVSGGMKARQTPSALETFVAQGLVELSIPKEATAHKNPLDASADGAAATAGRELYRKNCEICHGYDGSGTTAAGGGMYPPPPHL